MFEKKENKKRPFLVSPKEQKQKDKRQKNGSLTESFDKEGSTTILSSPPIPPPESTIPFNVQAVVLPESITCGELARTIHSMAAIMQTLQVQNAELIGKVGSLEGQVAELKEQLKTTTTTTKKSFAQIVSQSLAAPATQVTLLRAAELAQSCEARKASVIVRNVDLATDKSEDESFAGKIAKECKVSGSCSVFRIPLKNNVPPLLKLQLQSKQDAVKVLGAFEKIKTNINGCRNATVRPDLSKPELQKYRLAWKEAIRLNNENQSRVFTVRDLEVVKINYAKDQQPFPWTVRTNK